MAEESEQVIDRTKPWSLSSGEIEDYMRGVKGFLGTFPKDKIPTFNSDSSCIINFHDSGQPGSHWVAFWRRKGHLYYFDSYGGPPIKNVENRMRSNGKKNPKAMNYYNALQVQPLDGVSVTCGFYCMYMIMNNNKQFIDNVYDFSRDTYTNDEAIWAWFNEKVKK